MSLTHGVFTPISDESLYCIIALPRAMGEQLPSFSGTRKPYLSLLFEIFPGCFYITQALIITSIGCSAVGILCDRISVRSLDTVFALFRRACSV